MAALSVAGRIVAIRSFGKAAFAKLRDRTGEIQVWVKLDVVGEQAFALWSSSSAGISSASTESPAVSPRPGWRGQRGR